MGKKKKKKGLFSFLKRGSNKSNNKKENQEVEKKSRKERREEEYVEDDEVATTFIGSLKKETTEAIVAILFIVISIFLFLSPFNKAGVAGNFSFRVLSRFFGWGFYLIPTTLTILAVYYLKSYKKNMSWRSSIGAILFLVSGIGLLDLIFSNGGSFGSFIATPLLKLFDLWVSLILLFSISLISTLIIFNTTLNITKILQFLKLKKVPSLDDDFDDEDIEISSGADDEDDDSDEDEDEDEEDEKSKSKNKKDRKEEARKAKELAKSKKKDLKINQSGDDDKESKKGAGLIFFSKKTNRNSEYKAPPLSILEKDSGKPGVGDIKANANIIRRTLMNFGIQVEMDEVSVGPSVTRYALKPAEGVKLSKIVSLQNDLSLALAAHPLRIEAPIPGKSLVGIEIPNSTKTKVGFGTMLKQSDFTDSDKPLLLGMGKGVTGKSYFSNLAKAPHMLIAGATGSGKSVTIHALITSLLYRNSPEMLKFIMVDPKRVELTLYNRIPHLLTPVITDPKKTILALRWAAKEMNRRYDILQENGVRDIESYHKNVLEKAIKSAEKKAEKRGGELEDMEYDAETGKMISNDPELPETMPFIVIVIDELADIMQAYPRELEAGIVKLAQMSRAVGIHLIISTQRPSVNVITGLIKANVPTRVALQVASQIDSRTILDMPGAEKLLGQGDMLYLGAEMSQPVRVQSAFISEEEVKKVVDFLATQYSDELPDGDIDLEGVNNKVSIFDALSGDGGSGGGGLGSDLGGGLGSGFGDDSDEDDLYGEAKAVVIEAGKASTSYLQRKLGIGYSRAAKIIDLLEEKGIIGPANGSKPREIIAGAEEDGADDEVDESDDDESGYTTRDHGDSADEHDYDDSDDDGDDGDDDYDSDYGSDYSNDDDEDDD